MTSLKPLIFGDYRLESKSDLNRDCEYLNFGDILVRLKYKLFGCILVK